MPQLQVTNEIMSESSLIDILRDPSLIDFFKNSARSFDYSVTIPAVDTDCTQTFVTRRFVHHDWVDGQDMVQAGRTADNDGFNFLFHNLENDLDLAKADIATLFKCIAVLRRQIATQSAEIKAELNRIDQDLWTLTPNKTLVSKVPPLKYMGVTTIADQPYAVVQNFDGSFQTMAFVQDPGRLRAVLPNAAVDRLVNAQSFAQFTVDNPDFVRMFANNTTPTIGDVRTRFGGVVLDNGKTVGDLLAVLPATTVLRAPADLADQVADHEAAVVRSSSDVAGVKAAVAADPNAPAAVANAAISNVASIEPGMRAKLDAAGIKTVADLAGADAARLTTALGNRTDAAKLKAIGRTLKGIG